MLYKRSCSTKGATQCLGLTFKYHLWLTEPWSKTKPSVYHPYFASLINESISWLYCNFCWEFSCYFYTRLSDFLSNTCWLHVVVLILRVNLQKKVCFFFYFSMHERDIFFYNEKISCKNPFCISFVSVWMILLHHFFVKFSIFMFSGVLQL